MASTDNTYDAHRTDPKFAGLSKLIKAFAQFDNVQMGTLQPRRNACRCQLLAYKAEGTLELNADLIREFLVAEGLTRMDKWKLVCILDEVLNPAVCPDAPTS